MDPRIRIRTNISWVRNLGLFSCSQMTGVAKMFFLVYIWQLMHDGCVCVKVVRAAESCAATMAGVLPPDMVVRVLNPIVKTGDFPVNQVRDSRRFSMSFFVDFGFRSSFLPQNESGSILCHHSNS
jgi:hypothetical protein